MGHTFSNLLNHIVFCTKGRRSFLYKDMRTALYSYIIGIVSAEECQVIQIGGIENHIHILVKIKPSISISDFIRKIKTNSSKWIHKTYPPMKDFLWQPGFACFSVSASGEKLVARYIDTQEEHHKTNTYIEELKIMLAKHEIEFDENNLWMGTDA